MNLVTYAEFARLRLEQFLGDTLKLNVEKSGMQTVVGLGGYERYGETYFAWKQGEPYQTAGVALDLSQKSILPDDATRRIIEKLRLPIRKGMAASELLALFGTPKIDSRGPIGTRFMRFICGDRDLYYLGCQVHDRDGLIHTFIARKDYCDDEESL